MKSGLDNHNLEEKKQGNVSFSDFASWKLSQFWFLFLLIISFYSYQLDCQLLNILNILKYLNLILCKLPDMFDDDFKNIIYGLLKILPHAINQTIFRIITFQLLFYIQRDFKRISKKCVRRRQGGNIFMTGLYDKIIWQDYMTRLYDKIIW